LLLLITKVMTMMIINYDDDDDDDEFYMTFSTSVLTMLVHMSAEKAICRGT